MLYYRTIKFQPQYDSMDCGAACLKMVADYYGMYYTLDYLREKCFYGKEGISLLNLKSAATEIGFTTLNIKTNIYSLSDECPLPCIIHWNQNHFVVLLNVKKELLTKHKKYIIADPAHGVITLNEDVFLKCWGSNENKEGIALLLQTRKKSKTPRPNESINLKFVLNYLKPHKKLILQLVIGMAVGSFLTLLIPFLTQLLIDNGIKLKEYEFIRLIIIAQLLFFIGKYSIDVLHNWLLLHIGSRVSLTIISDFLMKLLALPIRFFDAKGIGDISQRINDHRRIEVFLTKTILDSIFSVFNIVVYCIILYFYSVEVFLLFSTFSIVSVIWILLFQKRRKQLDYKRFIQNKENQDKMVEMIVGMQDIKLFGNELSSRWEWERIQVNLFGLNIKSLSLENIQHGGYILINQLKNIIITFFASIAVVEGSMTLGILLSVSFIVGQSLSPLEKIVNFIRSFQDAKLSLDRMNEIHEKKNEEIEKKYRTVVHKDIAIDGLSFQYEGPNSPLVLEDICLTIPKGKTTAIVGYSGSGKTTLLKLLLGFYIPTKGKVLLGEDNLQDFSPREWRNACGTVMQDGYIFSDTIEKNIAMSEKIEFDRLLHSVKMANIEDFINSCPLKSKTKIGNNGVGISGGQKQRIFIARAIYKNPSYFFFDEATSSLDANNEKTIISNLRNVFIDKTVVIIAHRLSTVKSADQIVVLDSGKIVEQGNHNTLVLRKGQYYELVKNQLELEVGVK